MIMELKGKNVRLKEGELLRREESNREYLMKLENRYLLRNYLLEAGRYSGRGNGQLFLLPRNHGAGKCRVEPEAVLSGGQAALCDSLR